MASWNFTDRLLYFHRAHTGARYHTGNCDRDQIARDMRARAWPHATWFHNLSPGDKRQFVEYLQAIDVKGRVDPTSEYVQSISHDINHIVTDVVQKLFDDTPIFKGHLFKMGSSHNGMKVNAPDEYDFCVQLDLDQLLKGAAEVNHIECEKGKYRIYIRFEGDPSDFDIVHFKEEGNIIEYLSLNGAQDAPRYKSAVGKLGDQFVLHTEAVAFAFFTALDAVLREFKLPSKWKYGGFNRPDYSGLRLNMPAYTLQLEYQRLEDEESLMVSLDIAPVLRIPGERFRIGTCDLVYNYLSSNGFVQDFWLRLECGAGKGAISSISEEQWLSTYDFTSVAKASVRICKILHNMIPLTLPPYMPRYLVTKIADYQRKKLSHAVADEDTERIMCQMMMSHRETAISAWIMDHLERSEQYVTFKDVGENVSGHEYISSYIYKRLVMTLMAMDELAGRLWTPEELPEIVLSLFYTINDLIMAANQSAILQVPCTDHSDENTLRIRLVTRSSLQRAGGGTDQMSNTTDCSSPVLQDIERAIGPPEPPEMYKKLKSAITSKECDGIVDLFLKDHYCRRERQGDLDDRIACVLETLATRHPVGIKYKPRGSLSEEDAEELQGIVQSRCLVRKVELERNTSSAV